jgi:WhiB family redox-sensing transcriptional regulator
MTNRSTIRTSATSHLSTRGSADWRSRSACLDEDPELFFPMGTTRPALCQIEEAKAVCARCPVRAECLQLAIELGVKDGVWGGYTADEIVFMDKQARRRALRARRRADAGVTQWVGTPRSRRS